MKREKFTDWMLRLSGLLQTHSDFVPGSDSQYGLETGLLSLCAIADADAELSSLLTHQKILDLGEEQRIVLPIPQSFLKLNHKPSFEVVDILRPISLFASDVLHQLLGKSLRLPPITVDLKQSHVVVHDKIYPVDGAIAHIIDQLVRANGNPITRSTMKKNSSVLELEERIDRLITKIPKLLPLKIESSKRGYRLSDEWLA